jgi:hypothetical protein
MENEVRDTANIGLSEEMHMKLREMTDNEIFNDMKDGYRLAASMAIRQGLLVNDRSLANRKNMYDVGGVDEDFIFRNSISIIYPDQLGKEYKYLEKLADAGMALLYERYDEDGNLDLETALNHDP